MRTQQDQQLLQNLTKQINFKTKTTKRLPKNDIFSAKFKMNRYPDPSTLPPIIRKADRTPKIVAAKTAPPIKKPASKQPRTKKEPKQSGKKQETKAKDKSTEKSKNTEKPKDTEKQVPTQKTKAE